MIENEKGNKEPVRERCGGTSERKKSMRNGVSKVMEHVCGTGNHLIGWRSGDIRCSGKEIYQKLKI